MRKIAAIGLCFVALGLVYTLAQAQQRPAAIGPPAAIVPTVIAWEFSSQNFNEGQIQQLNAAGNQGWELVSVAPLQTVGMQVTNYVAYFKRPRLR
jgi:hypothetical protein